MRTENWLARSAATAPDRIALEASGETLTFAQLDERAASAARRLAALGAGPGERVGLVLGLSRDHITLIHALARLGAVAMPLDPLLPEAELGRRLESARAGLVIRDPGHEAGVGGPREQVAGPGTERPTTLPRDA